MSLTVSRSGNLVAVIRLRKSVNSASGTLTRNGRIAALSAECARWCVAIVSIKVLMGLSYRAGRLRGIRKRGRSGELTEPAALAFGSDGYLRRDLKAARTSEAKSCGCSHAAKWPPLSGAL